MVLQNLFVNRSNATSHHTGCTWRERATPGCGAFPHPHIGIVNAAFVVVFSAGQHQCRHVTQPQAAPEGGLADEQDA